MTEAKRICGIAGLISKAVSRLNLNSPKQLQAVLLETIELPKTTKTTTGYSTAAKEIEQLAVNHPHPFLDLLGLWHLESFEEHGLQLLR